MRSRRLSVRSGEHPTAGIPAKLTDSSTPGDPATAGPSSGQPAAGSSNSSSTRDQKRKQQRRRTSRPTTAAGDRAPGPWKRSAWAPLRSRV